AHMEPQERPSPPPPCNRRRFALQQTALHRNARKGADALRPGRQRREPQSAYGIREGSKGAERDILSGGKGREGTAPRLRMDQRRSLERQRGCAFGRLAFL